MQPRSWLPLTLQLVREWKGANELLILYLMHIRAHLEKVTKIQIQVEKIMAIDIENPIPGYEIKIYKVRKVVNTMKKQNQSSDGQYLSNDDLSVRKTRRRLTAATVTGRT